MLRVNDYDALKRLPATVLPFLVHLTYSSDNQFTSNEDIVFLANCAATEIMKCRQDALTALTCFVNESREKDERIIAQWIDKTYGSGKDIDYHKKVFLFYMFGYYDKGSKEMEDFFRRCFPKYASDLKQFTMNMKSEDISAGLKQIIENCNNLACDIQAIQARVKNPASLLSKSIFTGKIQLSNYLKQNELSLNENTLPYDYIGIRIVFKGDNHNRIRSHVDHLRTVLCNHYENVEIRKVLSPDFIFRSAIVGFYNCKAVKLPFQIQIRDISADNYEYLSYGNYKMNKIWAPFLADWRRELCLLDAKSSLTSKIILEQ